MKWLNRALINGPYLCLCVTEADLRAVSRRFKTKLDWPAVEGSCYTLENGNRVACVVCLRNIVGTSLEALVGLLAHEATHVKQSAMKFIGEDSPSSEFEAYTMQNITQNLLEERLRRVVLDKTLRITKLKD